MRLTHRRTHLATPKNKYNRPIPSCEDNYYFNSYAMECSTCSNPQVVVPLIVIGSIVLVVGGVAAYNYKYNYDYFVKYFEDNKERLFMHMNQGTMVVSE